MQRSWCMILLALVALPCAAHGEQTWGERLGFPAGRRVLILHANYLGAAYEFNVPGKEMLAKQQVTTASVMPACPWFEEFAEWCRKNPGHDVGVSLTLNSPSSAYRWGPTANRRDVASLVDADGYLWRTELQFALRANADEVRREIETQICKASAAGVRPTHITPFMGVLLTRSDLLEVYLQTAVYYDIPAVMVELTPENIGQFREEGFPLSNEMIEMISQYPLPKLDALRFPPQVDGATGTYGAKREQFCAMVRTLPPGITQIVFGAADQSPALKLIVNDWQNRVWDRQLLTDPQVARFLEDEEIVLTSWIEIMERFRSNGGDSRLNIK